jgi:hypothetical protein
VACARQARGPITGCDEPYIGDESIIVPPAAKKARMTSAQASRATASSPTLNVIQVPRPTSGRASPLDGIGRVAGPGAPVQTRARASSRRLQQRQDGRRGFGASSPGRAAARMGPGFIVRRP